eukprot:TRINITY_DN3123_c0_g1_i3.p1 TRINITY_DN3123_c0_g1~~TRINITY_DN3123_c0_g1_i3.p1  ORF type:complete len:548 (+),score=132.02 TRINITY_DN3123_c0_g1_i3:52-1695(+)
MAANDSTTYLINVHENYDTFQLQELPVEGPVLGEVRLGRAREGDARDEGPEGESSGKGYNTLVPCMNGVMGEGHSVVDLEEFKRRFKEMTGGLFEGVDWSNIVVIGGSIVSSLMGRNEGFEESDVDVYLYGIYDKEEAGRRIAELRKHFMKVAKGECATMRTPCTITMGFGKPYRNIQVITSPWASVDHILSTCDVDCSAVGFDGHAVYATPRARLAFNHRISAPNNRSLRIRGSNSYSKRLVKYCKRGFSVVDFFTPPDTLALYYPGRNSWTPRHIKDADFPFLTPSSVVVEKAPKTRLHKSPSPPGRIVDELSHPDFTMFQEYYPALKDMSHGSPFMDNLTVPRWYSPGNDGGILKGVLEKAVIEDKLVTVHYRKYQFYSIDENCDYVWYKNEDLLWKEFAPEDDDGALYSPCRQIVLVGLGYLYGLPARKPERSSPNMPNDTLPVIKEWCKRMSGSGYIYNCDYSNAGCFEYLEDGEIELDTYEVVKDPFSCSPSYDEGLLEPHHPVGIAMHDALYADQSVEERSLFVFLDQKEKEKEKDKEEK